MNRRQRNLFKYALSSIGRYKVRTLVVVIALTTSMFLFSSVAFLNDGLLREGKQSLEYAPDITVQYLWGGRQTFMDTSYIAQIESIPGVERVAPRVWGYGSFGKNTLVIMGVDLKNMAISEEAFPIEDGHFITERSYRGVVLGNIVAELIGAKVGDTISILTESVTPRQYGVYGNFNSESNIYNADMILMKIDDARAFYELPDNMVTDLAVYVETPEKVDDVARAISILPHVRILTKDIISDAQQTAYGARSGYFTVIWYIILIAVALIAFNQTVVVGHESMFEVGLLKALGFSTSDIISVRLMESLILGVLAASLGITGAIIYDVFLGAPVISNFMLGWATIYPSFTIPIYVNATTVSLVYALTILPLLFATVVPAWINATVDPDIAMRGAKA